MKSLVGFIGLFALTFVSPYLSFANCSRVEQTSGPLSCGEGYILVHVRTETTIEYTAVCNYLEPECQEANPEPCTPAWCWYEGCREVVTYYYECHQAPPPDDGGGDPPPNQSPIISIGQTPSGSYFAVGSGISFYCTASDPDEDPITVSWSGVSGSNGTNASLTIGSPGEYTVSATAGDGRGGSATAWATVYGFAVGITQITTPSPGSSFVSSDNISLSGQVYGVDGVNNQIVWSVGNGGNNSGTGNPSSVQGSSITFSPNPPSAPSGRGTALSYLVAASITLENESSSDAVMISQDALDQCRQEYIDMGKATQPGRGSFTNSGGSTNFSFSEMNTGNYSWAIVNIYSQLESVRSLYGFPMPVNSAYRNPIRNASVGGTSESKHLYGTAADIAVVDNNGNGSKADDSQNLAYAADAAGASFIQEYAPNYTHVHMNW